MFARLFLVILAVAAGFASSPAQAAASAQLVTPKSVSVLGGTSRVFSVRFFDALGRPSVGEQVGFMNDACGWFPNGQPSITVTTDATGLASTTFTARSQGITCWLVAVAGVQARFDVNTFTLGQVWFATTFVPAEPRPGEAFEVTVTPMAGAYKLQHIDYTARAVGGVDNATVILGQVNSGDSATTTFHVAPLGAGDDFTLEFQYQSLVERVSVPFTTTPWQDMWWAGPGENGWGVSIVQHRDVLFSVIYAYDGSGKPTWFVMPGGTWDATGRTYSGPLYWPKGSPYQSYDVAKLVPGAPIGQASIRFVDGLAVLDYVISGIAGQKTLSRQPFGPIATPLAADHGDMWWGGEAQNGWGIAVLQQYRALFGVWFTYDAAGAPTWFVMPEGIWQEPTMYQGRIFRTAGPRWLGVTYDPRALASQDVGSFRLRFSGDAATFEYTIEGRSGTIPLTRQPF